MKCHDAQKQFILRDGTDLPEGVLEHVRMCPLCQKLFEGNRGIRSLLALKRYETPDADFESRNAGKIRLYLHSHPRAGLREWFDALWAPLPVLRIVAAASILMLVAYHVGSVRLPSLSTPLAERSPAADIGMEPLAPVITRTPIAQPAPGINSPDPAITFVKSNTGPVRVQYGPEDSRPVSLEY